MEMTRWVAPALLLGGLASLPVAAPPLNPDQFDELFECIKPALRDDAWARVPWLTSLWQARQRAAREGKPILLWEMDGNPLGCT
jgi:hypothetical protein